LREVLRAIEGLTRIHHARGVEVEIGLLQIVIHRKMRIAELDGVALAHVERRDPTNFIRCDEDQVGFNPALVLRVRMIAGCRPDRCRECEHNS
jgi:hypothetical protein